MKRWQGDHVNRSACHLVVLSSCQRLFMSRRVWIVIGLAVAIYTVVLVFDLTPLVRGPIEWRWERWPVPQWDKVWPLAIALALIGLWVWWIDRRVNQPRWIALGLIGLILATPVVQLLAMRSDRDNPFE